MKTPLAIVLTAVTACILACGGDPADPGGSKKEPADSLQEYFHYSAQDALTHFGRYRVEAYVPPPNPTNAPDGAFTVLATSDTGHRVGKVAGRLALWPVGAAAPSYLFPADTNEASFGALAINDRQEVLLATHPTTSSTNLYVWKSSEMKRVFSQSGTCPALVRFTNGGRIGMMDYCQFHPNPLILSSPFSPNMSFSGRFAGQTCEGGINVSLGWIADDNDDLRLTYSGLSNRDVIAWNASGCLDLATKFTGLSVGWGMVGYGLATGSRGTGLSSPFGVAVMTDGSAIALVNDLIDATDRAVWSITAITRILPDRSMLARAVALSDSRVVTVKLSKAN